MGFWWLNVIGHIKNSSDTVGVQWNLVSFLSELIKMPGKLEEVASPRHRQRYLISFSSPTLLLSCRCLSWVIGFPHCGGSAPAVALLDDPPTTISTNCAPSTSHKLALHPARQGWICRSAWVSPSPHTCSSPSAVSHASPRSPCIHTHDWAHTAHPLPPLQRQFSVLPLVQQQQYRLGTC